MSTEAQPASPWGNFGDARLLWFWLEGKGRLLHSGELAGSLGGGQWGSHAVLHATHHEVRGKGLSAA